MGRIIRFVLTDILRNRIVMGYALLLAMLSWSVFTLEDNSSKGMLTILNFVLLVVPLMSVLFSTIYIYNSAEFIELLLSHPVPRGHVWKSLFAGLSLSLTGAYVLSAGIPMLLFAPALPALVLLLSGSVVTVIFVALAMLAAILSRDKARGTGVAILMWLYFALLFDGLVLFILFQFSEYPIEKPMVLMSVLSPLDMARILNLLQLDSSAMLGYTGAVFRAYFGSTAGTGVSAMVLTIWAWLPFQISLRIFRKKDL